MSDWREEAAAIRAALEKQKSAAATAGRKEPEGLLPEQTAFARRIVAEVLGPVLQEVVQIVTGTSAKVVVHEYARRNLGLTCELNYLRFSINVYLLFDSSVRVAVSLMPLHGDGWHKDFGLDASNEDIESWFGTALVRLLANR